MRSKGPPEEPPPKGRWEEDTQRLLQELQVHQIELEMQNDALRKSLLIIEESNAKFEDLYDFSPMGYFTLDRSGTVRAVNLTAAHLLGIARGLLLKLPLSPFVDERSLSVFFAHIEKVFTSGSKQSCELWLKPKASPPVPVFIESILTEDIHGKNHQCRSAIQDITKRKQDEEALRWTEERYATLFNSLIDGFCTIKMVFDGQGKPVDYRFIEINPAFEEHTGLREAKGKLMRSLAPAHEAHWFEIYGKIAMTGEPAHFEAEAKALNRWHDVSAFRVGNPENREVAILFKDITSRRNIAETMREQEEIFRVIFDQSPVAGAIMDLHQRITRTNRGLCHMLGYPEGEIVGKSLCEVMHPDDLKPTLDQFRGMIKGPGDPVTLDVRYIRKDGGIGWGQLTAALIRDANGSPLYGIGLVEDITERRRVLLALMERSTQLEQANNELDSFSYSITHDLRAPLRAIDGYSRMIMKRKEKEFDDETRRQFNLIRDNARTMHELIDDILAFSRIEKQEVVAAPIDMEDLVKEVWAALLTINPTRQVSLKMAPLPPAIGDRTLIKQVLTNLLSNAVKFTGTRDLALIEVGGHTDETGNTYFVKDNGAGFDMAYYKKLFRVFSRLHNTDEFEGTGVGLAIVQRIILRHGGRAWAKGEVDKGATFYFTLKGTKGL